MKRLKINEGTRDGYIYISENKYRTPEYRLKKVWHFSATNKEKSCLYAIYDALNKNIVRVLATLTSTGKTRVVLVEDNFFETFKKEVEEIEAEHFCHVAFELKEEWRYPYK